MKQEKRNVLVKQVTSVPGKDDILLWPTTILFLYGQVNIPKGFRSECLDLVEAGDNET